MLHARDAEIGEQRPARVLLDQDVRRLDVAVHDAAPVREVECRAHFPHHPQHLLEADSPPVTRREHALERVAPHEGHDQEGDPFARVELVDRHDMGVR